MLQVYFYFLFKPVRHIAGTEAQLYDVYERCCYRKEIACTFQAHAFVHNHSEAIAAGTHGTLRNIFKLKIHVLLFSKMAQR